MLKLQLLSPFLTYCNNGDTFIKVAIVTLVTRLVMCLHIKVFIMCVCVCVCVCVTLTKINLLANFSKNPQHKFVLTSTGLELSCSMWTDICGHMDGKPWWSWYRVAPISGARLLWWLDFVQCCQIFLFPTTKCASYHLSGSYNFEVFASFFFFKLCTLELILAFCCCFINVGVKGMKLWVLMYQLTK